MVIISADSLESTNKYYENKIKLKIIHFCPIDGREGDPKCKRIVVTTDGSQQTPIERYLVVVFYGCYAKTPFKKSCLKLGQLFTLSRFETGLMPNDRVFKCNGHILRDFYNPLVLVKPEFEPIIKMLVSLREETFIGINDNESVEDSAITDTETDQIVTPKIDERMMTPIGKSPAKKRLRFDSSDEENSSEKEDNIFDTNSRRTTRSSTNVQKTQPFGRDNNKVNLKKDEIKSFKIRTIKTKEGSELSPLKQRRHEYKTLLEVHSLMPVSGKTFCHIYGILRYRDFKQNTYHLRDEKAYTFTVHLRPGNSTIRDYPASKPGDILRIHRILLSPNTMDIICTDPKDVVVFEGFNTSESFSPIHSSLNPSFEEFDRNRKKELEEWFSDELIQNDNLSEKKSTSYSVYTDLAVQVIRVTTSRERTYLEVWDTNRPALRTFHKQVSTVGMDLNPCDEELVRIINENQLSVMVTVYEQHSNDAQCLKPFDFIVLFNVNIRTDRYNKDCYIYALNSGYNFGKSIRFVKPDSRLGNKLSAQIEEYKVMSAVNVSPNLSSGEFPSPSLPIDFENETQTLRQIQLSDLQEESLMDEEFDIRCDLIDLKELVEISKRKQMYLPNDSDVVIPETNVLFDRLLKEGVDSQLYKVKARVINYISKELVDIISICCTNTSCLQRISLRKAINLDPLLMESIKSSNDKLLLLNCFKCHQKTCLLIFKIILILEDNTRNKLMVELFGRNAELFLKRTPKEVLHEESHRLYIEEFFKYLCPKSCSVDSKNSYNVLIYWVIEPSKVDRIHFKYLIRSGIAIETADKCVGHKLNNF